MIAKYLNWGSLSTACYFIGGASLSFTYSVSANRFSSRNALIASLWILIPMAILFLVMGYYFRFKAGQSIHVLIDPTILRLSPESTRASKKGLVCLVSLYNPIKRDRSVPLDRSAQITAATSHDYSAFDFEKSNLEPIVRAIESHPSIQHCWLIGTTSNKQENRGSIFYLPAFVEFLKKVKGTKCEIHWGQTYAIPTEDDDLVIKKTYQMVRNVIVEAKKKGLSLKEILIDVTGGFRSMPTGAILGSLHKDIDIQIMGTQYDESARPTGKLFPILISFEPRILKD